jgi:hypothetical protein
VGALQECLAAVDKDINHVQACCGSGSIMVRGGGRESNKKKLAGYQMHALLTAQLTCMPSPRLHQDTWLPVKLVVITSNSYRCLVGCVQLHACMDRSPTCVPVDGLVLQVIDSSQGTTERVGGWMRGVTAIDYLVGASCTALPVPRQLDALSLMTLRLWRIYSSSSP